MRRDLGAFVIFLLIHLDNSCPPLPLKKGVNLECEFPQNETISDCSSKIPEGTVARFSCSKYYRNHEGPRQGEMLCVEDGIWEHFYDYEDFHCTIECGVTRGLSPVIVFGSSASKYDFPWHASIFLRNRTNDLFDLVCGGSLIDLLDEGPLILTAAHCLRSNLEDYRVILAANSSTFLENKDSDSQILGVSYYEPYPSFNLASLENDIAVMKLNRDIVYSDAVRPICLERGTPTPNVGDIGIVAGFGKTEEGKISKNLVVASLPARSRSECEKEIPADSEINFPASKFCAGFRSQNNVINGSNGMGKINPGICFGDSGGGLILHDSTKKHFNLVGIAHAAFKDIKLTCSGLGFFQSVGKYIGWIREVQKIVYPKKKTQNAPYEYNGVEILGSRCGYNPDWVEYKDEKCFRLIKQLATKEEASKICGFGFGGGNSLPIIKSSEEYAFLIKLLEEKRITNGVWLGAVRGPLGFQWDNGDGMEKYSKWAPNGNLGGGNCSIIQPRSGHWVEEDCETENIVVCQKIQELSNTELLETIIKLKADINELNAKLSIFIEKQSSMKADLDPNLGFVAEEKSDVINKAGSRVLGLRTGTWYTFSNKLWDDGPSYMTWMLVGTIKYGQLSAKPEYVNKYGSVNNLNGHWMIRKTNTPGAYTLYNRGAKGYLSKYRDVFVRIVEESELTPDDGYWCFTEGTASLSNSVKIHLCKATKEGLGYNVPETVEGFKLYLYPINSNGNAEFWSANLVGAI